MTITDRLRNFYSGQLTQAETELEFKKYPNHTNLRIVADTDSEGSTVLVILGDREETEKEKSKRESAESKQLEARFYHYMNERTFFTKPEIVQKIEKMFWYLPFLQEVAKEKEKLK